MRVLEGLKGLPTFLRKLRNEEAGAPRILGRFGLGCLVRGLFGLECFVQGLFGGFGSLFEAVIGGCGLTGTIFFQVF